MRRLADDPRVAIVGVVLSSRVLGRTDSPLRGGWRLFRRSGLAYLVYLWASTGLADLFRRRSVAGQASRLDCPVLVTRDINDADGQAFVTACQPDLLVSAFFNQRIAPAVFTLPPSGAVNIHPSLLPALKGVDPVFFACYRGVRPVGVSLHRIAEGLDTGHLLAQSEVRVARNASVLASTAALFERGAGLLLGRLESILAGDAGCPQSGEGGYDSWPSAAEVKALRRAGVSLWRFGDVIQRPPS